MRAEEQSIESKKEMSPYIQAMLVSEQLDAWKQEHSLDVPSSLSIAKMENFYLGTFSENSSDLSKLLGDDPQLVEQVMKIGVVEESDLRLDNLPLAGKEHSDSKLVWEARNEELRLLELLDDSESSLSDKEREETESKLAKLRVKMGKLKIKFGGTGNEE
ncbi:MAG: hypothetical protein G01um101418_710 [Parcubacteria group bacterium Gr01-1014_18]|nr:MAG: hypothetical protein Greene041636_700 [Parcubacteria group bacterium Greene0416_36]TSC80202.1 MAG: hypothetical protein G01um101418_710 [Parcubacteria group bacterium Gr01-1014_18]TSC98384.1 MAG: hypothetical protein Greene101420_737 [Parcubacteria group bacterium Greene1014_20]